MHRLHSLYVGVHKTSLRDPELVQDFLLAPVRPLRCPAHEVKVSSNEIWLPKSVSYLPLESIYRTMCRVCVCVIRVDLHPTNRHPTRADGRRTAIGQIRWRHWVFRSSFSRSMMHVGAPIVRLVWSIVDKRMKKWPWDFLVIMILFLLCHTLGV